MNIVRIIGRHLPKPVKEIANQLYQKRGARRALTKNLTELHNMSNMGNIRYDYFMIWGHGLKYKREIINMIRDHEFLEIKLIMFYKVKNMRKFIEKVVYGHDYAPFEHLKSKTKYLLNVNPNICFILVLNKNPCVEFVGEGAFKHIECMNIKRIKNEIRDKFNPRENGRRTEDHVIHASDNQSQVNQLLKFLGFADGTQHFERNPNPILSLPYHVSSRISKSKIKKIRFSQLYCRILKGDITNYTMEICSLEESPHYKYLTGDKEGYQNYLKKYGGYLLTDDHSIENLEKFFQDFAYLQSPYNTTYILVEEFYPNKYYILDGVHRAAKLLFSQQKELIVAVRG
jgi:hypothetical protein